jgi:lipoyl(octanoyl) transferase
MTMVCAPSARPNLGGLDVRRLGLVPYADAVRLQEELAEQRRLEQVPDTLLLLEHPPVVTLGRRAQLSDVYLPEAELRRRGIALERSSRGGLVTYHGPGQLVGYPILRPHALGRTIPEYVCGLQRALVAALAEIGVDAHLDLDHVGVWTSMGKIAAIGVAQRHGVTLHGFAVNVQPNLDHFALINPCGIGDLGVTSAAKLLGHEVDVDGFGERVVRAMCAEFGYAGPG